MVLDSCCDQLHRVAASRLCPDNARVVQGERKPSLLELAEPQPTLAEHFPNALQRYYIFRQVPNFVYP